MASKRQIVELKSTESPYTYTTTVPKNQVKKIETRKFDPVVRRHVIFKQKKVHKGS